jgi:hypothetical protein
MTVEPENQHWLHLRSDRRDDNGFDDFGIRLQFTTYATYAHRVGARLYAATGTSADFITEWFLRECEDPATARGIQWSEEHSGPASETITVDWVHRKVLYPAYVDYFTLMGPTNIDVWDLLLGGTFNSLEFETTNREHVWEVFVGELKDDYGYAEVWSANGNECLVKWQAPPSDGT